MIVVPGCGEHQADVLAKSHQFAGHFTDQDIASQPQPVLSIGLATIGELSNPTAQHLLEQADKRLYEIKSGRAGTTRLSA